MPKLTFMISEIIDGVAWVAFSFPLSLPSLRLTSSPPLLSTSLPTSLLLSSLLPPPLPSPPPQDQLEEVLDVVLANQRCMLGERHAQRKFLVHSLHSLKGLISETYSNTSNHIDSWFTELRRLVLIPWMQQQSHLG